MNNSNGVSPNKFGNHLSFRDLGYLNKRPQQSPQFEISEIQFANYSGKKTNNYADVEVEIQKQNAFLLEGQINALKKELEQMYATQIRNQDLETKIVQVSNQNQQLIVEIEQLNRNHNQKKAECALWKQKYESHLYQLVQMQQNYELEIKTLSNQIQNLLQRCAEIEEAKIQEYENMKILMENTHNQNLQNLIQQLNENQQIHDQTIRTLTQELQISQQEIDTINDRLQREKEQHFQEQSRLISDNEIIRNQVIQLQIQHQQEIDALRKSLNQMNDDLIKSLKDSHNSETTTLIAEINKLKELLQIKNNEIESLITSNQHRMLSYDEQSKIMNDTIVSLKNEINAIILEHQLQLDHQKQQLIKQYSEENANIQNIAQNQITQLKNDISHLQNIIGINQDDHQKYILEQENEKQFLKNQINELTALIANKEDLFNLECQRKNEDIMNLSQKLSLERQDFERKLDQAKSQIEFLNSELERTKEIIARKSRDNETTIFQFNQIKKSMETELKQYKYELESVKSTSIETEKLKNKEIEELKLRNCSLEISIREKSKQMDLQVEFLSNELKRTKENLEEKVNESENNYSLKTQAERDIRKYRDQVEELKNKLQISEREKLQTIEEITLKQKVSNEYHIENLQSNFNQRVTQLQSEISEIRQEKEIHQQENEGLKLKLSKVHALLNELKSTDFTNQKLLQIETELLSRSFIRVGNLQI